MKTVQANNIDKYFEVFRVDGEERLLLRGTSTNPLLQMIIIPSCIFFYLLGAGLNSAINPSAWGLMQGPALLGGIFGFMLPVIIMKTKKVSITFSPNGLGVGSKLYIWKNFGTFSIHMKSDCWCLSFGYDLDRIELPVGWLNKSVAMAILTELDNRSRSYSASA